MVCASCLDPNIWKNSNKSLKETSCVKAASPETLPSIPYILSLTLTRDPRTLLFLMRWFMLGNSLCSYITLIRHHNNNPLFWP